LSTKTLKHGSRLILKLTLVAGGKNRTISIHFRIP